MSTVFRKKKKKNRAEEIEAQASTSSPSSSRKTYDDEEEGNEEEKTEARTPAEIAFQKAQEKRVRFLKNVLFDKRVNFFMLKGVFLC